MIGIICIKKSYYEKLSSINFDEKLKLEKHRQSLSNGIKNAECMYSFDWVPLIRFSLFTSINIFSNISIIFYFIFLILVDIQVLRLHWPQPYKPFKTYSRL